jgi:hypothetical protein
MKTGIDPRDPSKHVGLTMSQFPIPQVIGGLIGGFGGLTIGFRLFSPRKPGIGWLAGKLRTLGALTIMGVGMMFGQIIGYFLHKLMA